MYLLNQSPIQTLTQFAPPGPEDFPRFSCKNNTLHRIEASLTPYALRVFSAMSAVLDGSPSVSRRYRYLDVKVQDLQPGQETANGLWHLDSSLNPVAEYDNLLFVTGAHARTEFVTNLLSIEHQTRASSFHQAIASQPTLCIERVPSCTLVRYSGSNVHRGPCAAGAERRLLLRMIATDVRLPSTRARSLLT